MVILMKRRHRLEKCFKFSSSAVNSLITCGRSSKMVAGSFYIPKCDELKPLGDDAHFICAEHQTIGVADGVGGWAKKGVDPGEYARELMANSVISIKDQPEGLIDPMSVLNEAFLNTEAKGSSTACILTLAGNILHSVNVGDSGFVLIRNGKIVYQSLVQQHRFNCPYQLGNTRDNPSIAQKLGIYVIPGDIVVAGTDGLFDNLHASEIEEVVNRGLDEAHMPQQLACSIAKLALTTSLDSYAISPFTKAAWEVGLDFLGGKIDDITVVVAYIVSADLL
ncbi:probable protein phosphatase 2C 55 [Actinidia eriantha]|uniref:probable protein phosphatase 2C 55 n=1 Tax=Actinidia eriantha TaxID=165200 RepID=UPI00258A67CB|nr:probable protein phosphatase 2C 55 [Actinidia eriantha]